MPLDKLWHLTIGLGRDFIGPSLQYFKDMLWRL